VQKLMHVPLAIAIHLVPVCFGILLCCCCCALVFGIKVKSFRYEKFEICLPVFETLCVIESKEKCK